MPVSVNVEFDLEKGAVPLNTQKEVPASRQQTFKLEMNTKDLVLALVHEQLNYT